MEEQIAKLLTSPDSSNLALGELFLKEMRLHPKKIAKLVGRLSIIDDWKGYNSLSHFSSKSYSHDRYGSYCHSDIMKVLSRNGNVVIIQLVERILPLHRFDNYRTFQYNLTFPDGIWYDLELCLVNTIHYKVGKFPTERYLEALNDKLRTLKKTIKSYHTDRIKQMIKNQK